MRTEKQKRETNKIFQLSQLYASKKKNVKNFSEGEGGEPFPFLYCAAYTPIFLFIPLSRHPKHDYFDYWRILRPRGDPVAPWSHRFVANKTMGPIFGAVDFVENQQGPPEPAIHAQPSLGHVPPFSSLSPCNPRNNNRNLPTAPRFTEWINQRVHRSVKKRGRERENVRERERGRKARWGLEAMWTRSKGRFVPMGRGWGWKGWLGCQGL